MIYSTVLITKYLIYYFLTAMQPKVGYIAIDILTDTLEGTWFVHLSQAAIEFIMKNRLDQLFYVLS